MITGILLYVSLMRGLLKCGVRNYNINFSLNVQDVIIKEKDTGQVGFAQVTLRVP